LIQRCGEISGVVTRKIQSTFSVNALMVAADLAAWGKDVYGLGDQHVKKLAATTASNEG
jgi:hypothetical protein